MPIIRHIHCDMCGAETGKEFYMIDAVQHIRGEEARFISEVLVLCPLCMTATGLGAKMAFTEREDMDAWWDER